MKVLLLSQYYSPEVGAPQTRLAAVVKELQSFGDTVEVVTAVPNYPSGTIQPGN
ncbi:MAG: group 1 glycosyl transferase [Acidimicrobiales bacterium]|nr:group 1 glycosyl transferase [Acidimicrobiales bacterium]